MLTRDENDLLTQTGPGTPMGDLFRRHWIPACLSEEIPSADCPPARVTLLSEKLIAFRDTNGNPGLVDSHCPHRGAPLFFGRNEECGIRCVYHGWKFDVDGNCVDLPNSPEGETYKDKVAVKAYPTFDGGGIVWAYMGPKDKLPPKPTFEWFDYGDDRRYLRKYLLRCNYFQAIEGDYDPSHGFFLHSTLDGNASSPGNRLRGGNRLNSFLNRKHMQVEDTPYGQMHIAVTGFGEGTNVATISQFYMPSFTGSGISGPNVYASNMRVPIDDESCFHYRLRWSYEPFSQQQVWEDKYGGYTYPEQVPGTFLAKENKDNDYLGRQACPEELLLHRHQGLPHPGPGACRGPVGPPRRPQPGKARHVRPEHHRRAPPPHQRGPRPDGGRGAQRPQQPQTPTESTPPA